MEPAALSGTLGHLLQLFDEDSTGFIKLCVRGLTISYRLRLEILQHPDYKSVNLASHAANNI